MGITLVTGATGFLGSAVVRHLLASGARVRILARPAARMDLLGASSTDIEVRTGDVQDEDSVFDAVEGVSRLIHCAAYVGVGQPAEWKTLYGVNVLGTRNVVNAALHHGVERMVATSSIAALGRPERVDGCLDERARWDHSRYNTAYGRSKYQAELEIARGAAEGLDALMVNPALIFGVGRPGENTWQIIEAIRTRSVPAVPSGSTNVVDVEDVAAGHLLALESGKTGERYLLSGENLTWKNVFGTLADALAVAPPRMQAGPRLLGAVAIASELASFVTRSRPLLTRESARMTSASTCYDNAKARQSLDWNPRPFRETAARIAAHFGTMK